MRILRFLPLAALAFLAGCSVALPFQSSSGPTCSYNGTTYQSGAGFPSSDGCNTCACGANGQVACTLRACAPVPQPATGSLSNQPPTAPACKTDADCAGQNLDTTYCTDGQWQCINKQCEMVCGLGGRLPQ